MDTGIGRKQVRNGQRKIHKKELNEGMEGQKEDWNGQNKD